MARAACLFGAKCGLQFRHTRRIFGSLKPERRQIGEALGQCAAPRGGHAVFGSRSHKVGRVPSHDQSALIRQHLLREVGVNGEIQRIRVVSVVMPFSVSHEVGQAGFHLDTNESAIGAQGEDVRPAVVVQPHLVQRRPAECFAKPGCGKANAGGALGRGDQGKSASMALAKSTSFCESPPAS